MITYEQVVDEIREIVASKPKDYVYPKVRSPHDGEGLLCQYFDKGKPSCIIGHWLARHDAQSAMEGENAEVVVPILVPGIEGKACSFLDYLQSAQDSGMTWIESFDQAIAALEERP